MNYILFADLDLVQTTSYWPGEALNDSDMLALSMLCDPRVHILPYSGMIGLARGVNVF